MVIREITEEAGATIRVIVFKDLRSISALLTENTTPADISTRKIFCLYVS